jgi:phenylacetate-CoA ligase
MDLSILIPCLNEEKNIEPLIAEVHNIFKDKAIQHEIVFVDDGSSDGTALEIEKAKRVFPHIVHITNHKTQGITESWSRALDVSHGKYVLTIDADRQYQSSDILKLYTAITTNAVDVVQGWRKDYQTREWTRKFLSRALSLFLNCLFLTAMHDIKSGFVIYKRDVARDIFSDRVFFKTFQHFFLICALRRGYTCMQLPISFSDRTCGESFIRNPFLFSCRVVWDIPEAIRRYSIFKQKKRQK